ncbi:MAG TPA: hypothetical protein VHE37_07020, partial [Nevskiaceae bacterium]|nr:hypothetical protein [Nevskiaceae bacterium]
NSQGFEGAFNWITPLPGLAFNTAVAYTLALTQVPFNSTGGEVPAGTQMAATPRWQTAVTASYTHYFGGWVSALALTDTYSGKAYNDMNHTHAIYDASLLNVDLSVSRPDWSFAPALAVGINNLTDRRELVGFTAGTSLQTDQTIYNRPRSLSLRLTAEFK